MQVAGLRRILQAEGAASAGPSTICALVPAVGRVMERENSPPDSSYISIHCLAIHGLGVAGGRGLRSRRCGERTGRRRGHVRSLLHRREAFGWNGNALILLFDYGITGRKQTEAGQECLVRKGGMEHREGVFDMAI